MIKRVIIHENCVRFMNVSDDKPGDRYIAQDWGRLILRGTYIIGLEVNNETTGSYRTLSDVAAIMIQYGFAEMGE